MNISQKLGYDFELLKSVKYINEDQKKVFLEKIKDSLWIIKDKTIAVLGLSFKPETDDIRSAPSLDIIAALKKDGAKLRVFDPIVAGKAKDILGERVKFCKDPYDACRDSDCLLIVTEWPEFKELDFKRIKKLMNRPLVIDGRNIYDPAAMKKSGFIYLGMGRK
jgi:UDPglucose 6-dehydrogenase